MDSYNWDRIPEEQIGELWSRQMIHTPRLTILRLKFKRGAVLPRHNHFHEQVTMVTAGSVRLEVDGEECVLRAGDVLRIPPDAPHMLEALEDSLATDVFSPAREDLRKPTD
jgi:quercetin dioxygenase-like cupin family protein